MESAALVVVALIVCGTAIYLARIKPVQQIVLPNSLSITVIQHKTVDNSIPVPQDEIDWHEKCREILAHMNSSTASAWLNDRAGHNAIWNNQKQYTKRDYDELRRIASGT